MAAMEWSDLLDRFGGNPARANSAVGAQREGFSRDPNLENLSPEELAEFDRFTHGAQFGQGVPAAAAPFVLPLAGGFGALNEISKLSPTAQMAIARITKDKSFIPNETTSKPSWRNVSALLSGMFEGTAYRR